MSDQDYTFAATALSNLVTYRSPYASRHVAVTG
jgi:hypothetical protein